jgi:hypothetical protein
MTSRQPDQQRRNITFVFIIILALLISFFLKNVRIGLLIGLALGLLSAGLVRRRQ